MASGGHGGLKEVFDKYSKFGKSESQLKEKDIRIDSKNLTKMLKDTGVLDSKYSSNLFDNDMARVLGKLTTGGTYAKGIKTFEFQGFKQLIEQVAESKKTSVDSIVEKIQSSGGPSLANVTQTANKETTGRMTDTSQYTGSHKERFDADGHGKGIEGRADIDKNTGYVEASIEILPKGRVRYGPVTVNPRKLPSKTLYTGRRSKYEVLSTDEEEKRRDRRERNRVAATKCREKRENVLSHLEIEYNKELKYHENLLKMVDALGQQKQHLESVVTNHLNECPLLNNSPSMVFGDTGFLSSIIDTPAPLLPSYQPPVYSEEEELSNFLDSNPILTNSAYDTDSSHSIFIPQQQQQPLVITMTNSSIERLMNSIQSPAISMDNSNNHSILVNSAFGASCAKQHSNSSEDDSLPSTRTNPYVC
ncbi:unnamed protein product [Adineta steineri]|uniref:BZIP domain-containing protein n=1 Tax=Adineta steineri TaxID=433720 RepID=A0A815FS03_9BILA|nr:unnamed protein product [Adineta steineri]